MSEGCRTQSGVYAEQRPCTPKDDHTPLLVREYAPATGQSAAASSGRPLRIIAPGGRREQTARLLNRRLPHSLIVQRKEHQPSCSSRPFASGVRTSAGSPPRWKRSMRFCVDFGQVAAAPATTCWHSRSPMPHFSRNTIRAGRRFANSSQGIRSSNSYRGPASRSPSDLQAGEFAWRPSGREETKSSVLSGYSSARTANRSTVACCVHPTIRRAPWMSMSMCNPAPGAAWSSPSCGKRRTKP